MREIKFRAWDKENEVMADVDFFSKSVIGIKNAEFEDIENFILLQFTGLHDKNGKEIYEGDIVEFTHRTINGGTETYKCVVFQKPSGAWWMEGKMQDCTLGYKTSQELYCNVQHCKVIGNRFENPELLKEEVK